MREHLDQPGSLRLMAAGGVGRLACNGRDGPAVLPVSGKRYKGSIVFRTAEDSAAGGDLRAGIAGAGLQAACETGPDRRRRTGGAERPDSGAGTSWGHRR